MSVAIDRMTAAEYGSKREVAARLGISTKTVDRRLTDGTLTRHRIGGLVRISWAEVDALLNPKRRRRAA